MLPRRQVPLSSLATIAASVALFASLQATASAQQTRESRRAASDSGGALVTVSGTVYDSLAGKPLEGALVQVVAKGDNPRAWSATTDVNGTFEIAGIPHGLFLVGFLHPTLDSLGLSATPEMLDVRDGAPGHLTLAIPSAQTVHRLLCAGAQPGDSTGLLLGFIRDADTGTPLGGASVVVTWTEIVVDERIHTDRRSVPAKSNGEGWYALCGVPTYAPIVAHAESGEDASGYIEVTVPPEGVLHRDFNIPHGAAAVAVSNGGESGGGIAAALARRGSARLAGVVRDVQGHPLGSAQLMVWGSNITGSTHDDGTFELSGLPAGTQSLEVRYVGYVPKRVAVDLVSDRTRSVSVTLDQRIDALEQVTVYGKASKRRSDITGFLQRRRAGIGHFLTREDITKLGPFQFTDILRWVPGIELLAKSNFDYTILATRATGMLHHGCEPVIYMDGARIADGVQINGVLRPADIAGIEIYAGPSETPPQYSDGNCGSILIWTGADIASSRDE